MERSHHILLVEDHAPMREAVAELIEADDELDVIAAVESAEEALELVDGACRPDLAVVDLNLPGMHGLELVAELERRTPHFPVIVLSSHAAERFAPVALDAGAQAYVEKIRTVSDLVRTARGLLDLPVETRSAPSATVTVSEPPPQAGAPDDPDTAYESRHPLTDDFAAFDGHASRVADSWLH